MTLHSGQRPREPGRTVLALPPVYSADKIGGTIVDVTAMPRNEVAIGTAAKALVREHRRHPKSVELQMVVAA